MGGGACIIIRFDGKNSIGPLSGGMLSVFAGTVMLLLLGYNSDGPWVGKVQWTGINLAF